MVVSKSFGFILNAYSHIQYFLSFYICILSVRCIILNEKVSVRLWVYVKHLKHSMVACIKYLMQLMYILNVKCTTVMIWIQNAKKWNHLNTNIRGVHYIDVTSFSSITYVTWPFEIWCVLMDFSGKYTSVYQTLVCSGFRYHLNTKMHINPTGLDNSNTKHVWYWDLHCTPNK